MKRKICVVTGSRAEYGLLRGLMDGIRADSELILQLVVTGMHLSPEFGLTFHEIEADGFTIDKRVETLLSSDTPVGIAKAMGLGVIGFADALEQLNPDMLVVLGDRFEIQSVVLAALVACIPVAHIHGGELTEGAFDDSIRHSITKMSHLHFVAAPEYRQRVIQLGEQPERVHFVGYLGLDSIRKMKLLNRSALESSLAYSFGDRNLLVTFHPATLELNCAKEQISELLAALNEFPDIHIIFTRPNADTNGRIIIELIEEFSRQRSNSIVFTSLGQLRYFSCLKIVDAVVGNSSSGIIEAPSFKKATINIGDRQKVTTQPLSELDRQMI